MTSTTGGQNGAMLKGKKDAAVQKLSKLARAIKEESDEQKKAFMALNSKFLLIQPYPPCVQCLDQLEEITLGQMQLNTKYHGKMVWLTKFSELVLFRPTNTILIVNDRNLDPVYMEILLADQRLRAHGLFPPGTAMALKEPFKTKGEFDEEVLRVDHLSDIITVTLEDSRVPQRFVQVSDYDQKATALQWKERGNEALKKSDHAGAVNAYTLALAKVSEHEEKLRCDLHRNRAQAQLMLGRYYAAQKDAELAICGVAELDVKAKFRIAVSYYEREDYASARGVLEQPELSSDRDSQLLLQRVKTRQLEEEQGNFDFSKVFSRLSKQRPRIDAGSYLQKVEVRTEGALAGRGLFAAMDIEAGDIVLCSKPLVSLFFSEPGASFAYKHDLRTGDEGIDNFGLWRKLVNMLEHDPGLIPKVNQLQSKHVGLGDECLIVDGKPVVDVFQIHDILFENKMRVPDGGKISTTREFGIGVVQEEDWEISGALWDMGSRINHECLANVHKVFIGDIMLLRAVRPLKAGEEITLSYINPLEEKRRDYLQAIWGIDCQCALCKAERSDGFQTTQTRQKASVDFIGRNLIADVTKSKAPSNAAMQRAKALIKQVDETYDRDAYAEVPRSVSLLNPMVTYVCSLIHLPKATLAIATWIVQAHYVRKEHAELFLAAREFFLAMGYTDASFDGHKMLLVSGKGSILPKHGIDVLQMLASVKLRNGDRKAATTLERMAKRFYTTMNGLENGYNTINVGLA